MKTRTGQSEPKPITEGQIKQGTEMHRRKILSTAWKERRKKRGALSLPGLSGFTPWSDDELLIYIAEAIRGNKTAIMAKLIPGFDDRDLGCITWREALHIAEMVRIAQYERPQRFGEFGWRMMLPGLAGHRQIPTAQLLLHISAMCYYGKEVIQRVFIPADADPKTALIWAEVLVIAEAVLDSEGIETGLIEVEGGINDPSPLQAQAFRWRATIMLSIGEDEEIKEGN